MAELAVFISDLHMSNGGVLERFEGDHDFHRLLQLIHADHPGQSVDLVFLGDTFDLWQVVPAADWEGPMSSINLEVSPAGESLKAAEAIRCHRGFFQDLGDFLEAGVNRKVWFIVGNHDHGLVDSEVQRAVQVELKKAGVPVAQIEFGLYYEDLGLGVYAEHGNQSDYNNKYSNFGRLPLSPADECPGYGFVRLFWNAMCGRCPGVEDGPGAWYTLFEFLIKNRRWRALGYAVKRYQQYREYTQVPIRHICLGQKAARYIASDDTPVDRPLVFMEALLEDDFVDEDNLFSGYDEVEQIFRQLYYNSDPDLDDFRTAVREIVRVKLGGAVTPLPLRPAPGSGPPAAYLAHPPGSLVNDSPRSAECGLLQGSVDVGVSEKMFTHDNVIVKGGRLDSALIKHVIMGHTHSPVSGPVPRVAGADFINPGAWNGINGSPGIDRRYARIWMENGSPRAELIRLG